MGEKGGLKVGSVLASESIINQFDADFSWRPDQTVGVEYKKSEDHDGAEWLIKLVPFPTSTEWTLPSILSVESDEKRASRLAVELQLVNLGHIQPFPNVFWFGHDSGATSRKAEGVVVGEGEGDKVDQSLAEHPSLMWASKERALVRKKRTDYLQLNDPMFKKQWHLVQNSSV